MKIYVLILSILMVRATASNSTTSAHGGATESAGTTGGAVVSPNAPVSPLSFEEARRAALRRAEERAAMPRPLFGSFASDP